MISPEWHLLKNEANLQKHGISFADAVEIWNDPNMVEVSSRQELDIEQRFLVIGLIDKKSWTAIVTKRADNIRLISVRRSRKSEEQLYGAQEKNKR